MSPTPEVNGGGGNDGNDPVEAAAPANNDVVTSDLNHAPMEDGVDEGSRSSSAAAPVANFWVQTRALVAKNLLIKSRTILATFAELFSPAILLLILVLGYSLSSVENRTARTYASWHVDLPGPYLNLLGATGAASQLGEALAPLFPELSLPEAPNVTELATDLLEGLLNLTDGALLNNTNATDALQDLLTDLLENEALLNLTERLNATNAGDDLSDLLGEDAVEILNNLTEALLEAANDEETNAALTNATEGLLEALNQTLDNDATDLLETSPEDAAANLTDAILNLAEQVFPNGTLPGAVQDLLSTLSDIATTASDQSDDQDDAVDAVPFSTRDESIVWEQGDETMDQMVAFRDAYFGGGTKSGQHQRRRQLSTDSLVNDSRRRRLQFATDDDDSLSEEDLDEGSFTTRVLRDLRLQVAELVRSPIPVPTFQQFVALSVLITSVYDVAPTTDAINDSQFVRLWGNLISLGTIHLTPSTNPIVPAFAQYMEDTFGLTTTVGGLARNVTLRQHATEEEGLAFINDNLEERTWALIHFGDTGLVEEDVNFEYKIRMNYTTLPNTNLVTNYVSIGLFTHYERYFLSGYLTLQRTLNEFAFSRLQNTTSDGSCVPPRVDEAGPMSMPMPTAAYSQNSFFTVVGYLIGLSIAMAYLYPMSRLVKSLVEEKETRMKETLAILGVRPLAHWLSWVITSGLVFLCITVTVTLLFTSNIFQYSSRIYVFAFIGLFSSATVAFSFFLASFFSRAKLAAIIGPVALFATLLPRWVFFGTNRYEAGAQKLWASILPCTTFALGAEILSDYEYAQIGVQSYNAGEGVYSFNTAIFMLFFDTLFYFWWAWYLEQVIPRQYGVAKKWYFIFLPRYWCGCFRRTANDAEAAAESNSQRNKEWRASLRNTRYHEPVVDETLKPTVQIHNLVKQYSTKEGVRPAVNKLNLELYESQITCLLGHNGAGKTTTISILSGLFPPTSGDCIIYGHSIVENLVEARQSMGICPQQNILFDNLTVMEHIRFFQTIKGVHSTKEGAMENALEVGLGDFLYTASAALSGGNKRKLALAIAFCGNPQFLLLDEPTSGMDPHSRRSTWELLRRKRRGRVTLLTTHFMDEAELLADRVAVLQTGRLQCSGSNLFLKEMFGLGYNLTVVLGDKQRDAAAAAANGLETSENVATGHNNDDDDEGAAVTDSRNGREVEEILSFLREYIPETSLVRKSAQEVVFRFPQGREDVFPSLCDALESDRNRFDIRGYGLNNTTLEEVFLQLSSMEALVEARPAASAQAAEAAPQQTAATAPQRSNSVRLEEQNLEEVEILAEEPTEEAAAAESERNLSNIRETAARISALVSNKAENLVYLSWWAQIWILFRKRFIVQMRDLKGAFFLIGVPALLVALTLLILTIEPRLAGQAIELSIGLYEEDTSVWMGGGVGNETRNLTSEYAQFQKSVHETYPNSVFDWISKGEDGVDSSQSMSDYMLETYNDRTRDVRFGAFVLSDAIDFVVEVDWESLSAEENAQVLQDVAQGALRGAELNVSALQELRDSAAELLSGTPINATLAEDFLGAFGENATRNLDDFVQEDGTISLQDLLAAAGDNAGEASDEDTQSQFLFDVLLPALAIATNSSTAVPNETAILNFTIPSDWSIIHNSSSAHAVASFHQVLYEYLYNQCTKSSSSSSSKPTRLISVNHPLPLTTQQSVEVKTVLSILSALFILIPLCYAPASFVVFLVKENTNKSKHLQLVSGVDMLAYWIATYLWDVMLHLLLTILVMLIFLIYGTNAAEVFVGNAESFFCVATLVFGYGLSALPFAYLFSRYFRNHSTAQVTIMGIFFFTGFIAVNSYFVMVNIEKTADAAESLQPLLLTWPAYVVGDGFINMARSYWETRVLGQPSRPFDWDVAGKNAVLLYVLSVPYFVLLLMLEYSNDGGSGGLMGRVLRYMRSQWDRLSLRFYGIRMEADGGISARGEPQTSADDEDVANERQYVEANREELRESAPVLIKTLWKVFPPSTGALVAYAGYFYRLICCCCFLCRRKRQSEDEEKEEKDSSRRPRLAVRGLALAVQESETFGLLGVNGAGKTTTLGILTGDVAPTSGDAFVAGFDVTGKTPGGVLGARKNIGFCPQVDPLIDLMTGRETLMMFGRLRGIPLESLPGAVDDLLEALTLKEHADKVSEAYSGGNKRKLSLGVALIGNPRVLFIDEASSGMDPSARRKIWDLIEAASHGRSVILTTHSMEEAEALCTRVGIMVGGRMRCLGSVQHLKSKYFDGYTIDVRCSPGASVEEVDRVRDHVVFRAMPGSRLMEQHGRFLRFDVPSMSGSRVGGDGAFSSTLGRTFHVLQAMKSSPLFLVDSYSVSQCTLEQVFVSLVAAERNEPGMLSPLENGGEEEEEEDADGA